MKSKGQKINRNYGIDCLRLVTMYMVVVLHVLGRGGILTYVYGANYYLAWLLEVAAYCAVDCFAMISGYVGYTEKEKPIQYQTFIRFWAKVFFYSFGITLIYCLFFGFREVGVNSIIKSMLPVATKQYWYISAYAGLFFLIPWINRMLRTLKLREWRILIAVIVFVFIAYGNTIRNFGDCFSLQSGYSMTWLAMMYIIGAYIKKSENEVSLSRKYIVWGGIFCLVITWIVRIAFEHDFISNMLLEYSSPTICFIAFALVVLFSHSSIGRRGQQIVKWFSPATLAVYLIHNHPIIKERMITNGFIWICKFQPSVFLVLIFANTFLIFASCLVIEKCRLLLFEKVKIYKCILEFENFLVAMVKKTEQKFR